MRFFLRTERTKPTTFTVRSFKRTLCIEPPMRTGILSTPLSVTCSPMPGNVILYKESKAH